MENTWLVQKINSVILAANRLSKVYECARLSPWSLNERSPAGFGSGLCMVMLEHTAGRVRAAPERISWLCKCGFQIE